MGKHIRIGSLGKTEFVNRVREIKRRLGNLPYELNCGRVQPDPLHPTLGDALSAELYNISCLIDKLRDDIDA